MNLVLNLLPDKVILSLKKGRKTLAARQWEDQDTLSRRLLGKIDLILRKNNISRKEIRFIAVKNEIPHRFTATRIAKSIGKAYNFAVRTSKYQYLPKKLFFANCRPSETREAG